MRNYNFTAYIEKDMESNLYFGYVPNLQGAHTQGETLDELNKNLQEVVALCLEELPKEEIEIHNSNFVGTQKVSIRI